MPYFKMQDGESLHVRTIGEGEPVLVLSGLGMTSWQWLPYILPSLKNRSFIIPDFRGFGGSKNCRFISERSAIDSHWEDINSLIHQLDFKELSVIGYSMGATTTMHGLKYGNFSQHINRYLHIDQAAKIKNDEHWKYGLFGNQQSQFLSLIEQICALLQPYQNQFQKISQLPVIVQKELTALWLRFLALQNPTSKLQKVIQEFPLHKVQAQILPMQSIQYIVWYLQTYLLHDEDYRAALAALDKPAQFIIGKKSALYPYQGQLYVAEQLKDANIHLLKESGHIPLMNEPLKFTKILNQFLQTE